MCLKITSRFSILFLVIQIMCTGSYAQKKDSATIYEKLKKFSSKRKFTALIYSSIFVDPKPQAYPTQPASTEEKNVNPYLVYEGMPIKRISVTVYDPFGHSVNDTLVRNMNYFEKLGNRAHVTTRHWVIRNKLLFKENDELSALSISESERLLRQAVYVSDARIFVKLTRNSDSVIVDVVVQDKWPITVPVIVTDIFVNARFRNQNLLGTGQQFEQFGQIKRSGLLEFNGFYNIANIENTYISSQLSYQTDITGTSCGLSFDRPFYSPLATWAGGVSLSYSQRFYNYSDTLDGKTKCANLTRYSYDVWAGKSIKINSTKSLFDQSTNLIVGGRYYSAPYLQRPSVANDIIRSNYNTTAFIGNVGFALQQYYKDKFIYRFGANEDVPEGLICQILYGAEKKEISPLRYYAAIEIARAKHFNFGYLTSTFSHSIFFNKYSTNNITNNYRLYYFSDLLRLGKWYMREFVNYNLVYGQNKEPGERITLSADEMYGFNSGSLNGTKKMVMNLETVAYAPYDVIGFKFAPVLLIGAGMIGDQENRLLQSNLYQAYSLGLMVRNENLISSTFQVSVGMYPFLPGRKDALVTYNPVVSFTLRVRGFAVSKPGFIGF
jgi:hypothetical protein